MNEEFDVIFLSSPYGGHINFSPCEYPESGYRFSISAFGDHVIVDKPGISHSTACVIARKMADSIEKLSYRPRRGIRASISRHLK